MNYEVIITNQAESDLQIIYEYIAFELFSPQHAAGQLDRLEKHIIELERFPEKFKIYEKEPWHSRELRVMPIDNYLVLYILNKEEKIVTVIRVMYAGRDIDKQLKDHTQM